MKRVKIRTPHGERTTLISLMEQPTPRVVAFPLWALVISAGLGFLGGVVGSSLVRERGDRASGIVISPESGATVQAPSEDRSADTDPIVGVVERASPAVVSVVVTKDLPELEDVLLDPFGGPYFGPSPFRFRVRRPSGRVESQEVGGGTGFVVDPAGLLITNRHVVSDEEADYSVIFNTGEKVSARVLARDPVLDLAVLKVEKRDLAVIPLGDASKLRVGQTVVAIGNALGEFRNTVSVGVISGLGRHITAGDRLRGEREVLDQVIQTDAAINPGNSGGPLLNVRGEAIGVNTAIASGAENIGFALPASEASRILTDVRDHGKSTRPFLGVRYVQITPAVAKANGLPVDYGALVVPGEERGEVAVIPGSPGDRAGIRENDVLLELDGQKLDAEHSLSFLIRQKRVGDRVRLKILSRGTEKTVEVTLDEAK